MGIQAWWCLRAPALCHHRLPAPFSHSCPSPAINGEKRGEIKCQNSALPLRCSAPCLPPLLLALGHEKQRVGYGKRKPFSLGRGKSHLCMSHKHFPALSPSLKTCLFPGSHPRANLLHCTSQGILVPLSFPHPSLSAHPRASRRRRHRGDWKSRLCHAEPGQTPTRPGTGSSPPHRRGRTVRGIFGRGSHPPPGAAAPPSFQQRRDASQIPRRWVWGHPGGFPKDKQSDVGFPRDKLGAGTST